MENRKTLIKETILNIEIRDQKHLIGTSDEEPYVIQISEKIKKLGYNAKAENIKIFYDNMEGFWRFSADIKAY